MASPLEWTLDDALEQNRRDEMHPFELDDELFLVQQLRNDDGMDRFDFPGREWHACTIAHQLGLPWFVRIITSSEQKFVDYEPVDVIDTQDARWLKDPDAHKPSPSREDTANPDPNSVRSNDSPSFESVPTPSRGEEGISWIRPGPGTHRPDSDPDRDPRRTFARKEEVEPSPHAANQLGERSNQLFDKHAMSKFNDDGHTVTLAIPAHEQLKIPKGALLMVAAAMAGQPTPEVQSMDQRTVSLLDIDVFNAYLDRVTEHQGIPTKHGFQYFMAENRAKVTYELVFPNPDQRMPPFGSGTLADVMSEGKLAWLENSLWWLTRTRAVWAGKKRRRRARQTAKSAAAMRGLTKRNKMREEELNSDDPGEKHADALTVTSSFPAVTTGSSSLQRPIMDLSMVVDEIWFRVSLEIFCLPGHNKRSEYV
ncbi:hypothetical protein QBC35DRAFT_463180 [Podospora australis]|uniref:Uncharacterized protein n=1 Tax=Podospora australis TaxID=1536484 RepID=A0AAN6WV57_9PEZI|nr:hypothetical protein QBC35DRAFT_463180 [Podospora australis]